MAGGLMNLAAEGQQNIILNGNPSKTFFKATYAKYTNFGLQKFRVDFEGSKTLRLTEESQFTFKIPRYADLLMDSYISVDLPNIWSPIVPPVQNDVTNPANQSVPANRGQWVPYEFRWIPNIGAQMIALISITCGGQTLQEFSGEYLLAMVQRDFTADKKALFDAMTGNVPELVDPANAPPRVNSYPNAYYTSDPAGCEPSIRGRTIYIPLNTWFNNKSQMAFPLIALQYNELHVNITFRPIQELFQIRDVYDVANNFPYIAPNFNLYYMQFYRFLQPPPDIILGPGSYVDTRTLWNADINLNCTYCFLSDDESRRFALHEHKYLIKQVRQTTFYNVTGPNTVLLDSLGMVCAWMMFFRRSDANLRNEWSNYTNWPYGYMPSNVVVAPTGGNYGVTRYNPDGSTTDVYIGPGVNTDGTMTGWLITSPYSSENQKTILVTMGILLDGIYRENMQPVGVFNFVEKYTRTPGSAPDGLLCYNFALHSSHSDLQPSGAINMSRFTKVELKFVTIVPSLDPLAQTLAICDPSTHTIVGINKPTWRIYDYNFDFVLFEERINMISFIGGNCALMYAT